MATCSPNDFIALANCFICFDQRQIEMVKVAILCGIWKAIDPMASCDLESLVNDSKCFNCLDTKQLHVVQAQLLCEILQGGGMGGTSCNLCGTIDPVNAPSCNCSIYTRTDTGELWYWEPTSAAWVKILSNT